jgi:type III restriction enzyme
MSRTTIDHLIINSPFEVPKSYWHYDRQSRTFDQKDGRRPAGYVIATPGSQAFDDPGVFVELPLVNAIRPRVKKWREDGYAGVSGITRRLLEHWNNREERVWPMFFCQLEAMETLIWLVEGPSSEKVGIEIPGDGGAFARLCSKMATGSGKTIVMGMLIAWQILNKVTYPQDARFSKYILIVAPGLTVKSRLGVLMPGSAGNFYDEFNIVPAGLAEKLRQGKILINNWHKLSWDSEEQLKKKRSVDKRGAKSDEAYVREVLGEMANAKSIVVINDEAHHAWRVPAGSKIKGLSKEDVEEATKWVGGLDRIHKARGILTCFDFSATPFVPLGKKSSEETLFGWVISDFGLNDAIESGLVKTPRVVIRDDSQLTPDYKSRFYHIYRDQTVKDDINRKGALPEDSLPDLVNNAYYLLGKDWLETAKLWEQSGRSTPPVMITVANTTLTAARVKYAFDHKKIRIDELCVPEKTLHIDSKVMEMAEAEEEPIELNEVEPEETENEEVEEVKEKKLTRKQFAEQLRRTVDTVGKKGMPGEQIQKVISVGMLSEGWDAKTVTHIMGLRAFTSQLLCEQVVGRGLRRTTYELQPGSTLFEPEYVNIFGVPFTFLPHESDENILPPPPTPKTAIEPIAQKKQFEISWPNVIRIDRVYKPQLVLDMTKVKPLELNAFATAQLAELAPIVEGKADVTKISSIDLEDLGRKFRMQKIIFEAARDNYDVIQKNWKGSKEMLLAQLIRIVENFVEAGKIQITPSLFHQDEIKKRIVMTLNMNRIVQHIKDAIDHDNVETLEPVFDKDYPIRSTGDMKTWFTGKPCEHTKKSHINFCVFDSTWEASEAFEFDRNESVSAWVKNDHLGFEILYTFDGVIRKYRPDFIIRLKTGEYLILETKGQDTHRDKTKRAFLDEWVRAINNKGGFGKWKWAVSFNPADLGTVLTESSKA